jgi:hypothetical protein
MAGTGFLAEDEARALAKALIDAIEESKSAAGQPGVTRGHALALILPGAAARRPGHATDTCQVHCKYATANARQRNAQIRRVIHAVA